MTRTGERLKQFLMRVIYEQSFVIGDRVVFKSDKKVRKTKAFKTLDFCEEANVAEQMRSLNRPFEIRDVSRHSSRRGSFTIYKLDDVDENVDINHREDYEKHWFPDSWLKKTKKKRSISERQLQKLLNS